MLYIIITVILFSVGLCAAIIRKVGNKYINTGDGYVWIGKRPLLRTLYLWRWTEVISELFLVISIASLMILAAVLVHTRAPSLEGQLAAELTETRAGLVCMAEKSMQDGKFDLSDIRIISEITRFNKLIKGKELEMKQFSVGVFVNRGYLLVEPIDISIFDEVHENTD